MKSALPHLKYRLGMAILFLLICGCTSFPKWKYDPQSEPVIEAKTPPLKIALLPATEGRQDNEQFGSFWYFYSLALPGLPYVTSNREDHREKTVQSGVATRSLHPVPGGYPTLELYTWSLRGELLASGLARRVDIGPRHLEDYDLVLRPTLLSTGFQSTLYLYFLPQMIYYGAMVGLPLNLLGLPAGSYELNCKSLIVAFRGQKKEEPFPAEGIARSWIGLYYNSTYYDLLHQGYGKMNSHTIRELRSLANRNFKNLTPQALRDERILRYWESLDSDLVRFRQALSDSSYSRRVKIRLARQYILKAGLLEALRRWENRLSRRTQNAIKENFRTKLKKIHQLANAYLEGELEQNYFQSLQSLQFEYPTVARNLQPSFSSFSDRPFPFHFEALLETVKRITNNKILIQKGQKPNWANHIWKGTFPQKLKKKLKEFTNIRGQAGEIRLRWLQIYSQSTFSFRQITGG